jgi:hypothetical protein
MDRNAEIGEEVISRAPLFALPSSRWAYAFGMTDRPDHLLPLLLRAGAVTPKETVSRRPQSLQQPF